MGDFSFDFVSRSGFEHLAIEISYRGQLLCAISAERGPSEFEVEFLPDSRMLCEDVPLRFSATEFLGVFARACAALNEANGSE